MKIKKIRGTIRGDYTIPAALFSCKCEPTVELIFIEDESCYTMLVPKYLEHMVGLKGHIITTLSTAGELMAMQINLDKQMR